MVPRRFRAFRQFGVKVVKDGFIPLRKKIFAILGSKCIACGFDDERALQIDHVNGGGLKARRKLKGKGYGDACYRHVLKSIRSGNTREYQILCANCNWIKRHEKREAMGNQTRTLRKLVA